MSVPNKPFESINFYDNSQITIPKQNSQLPLYKRFQQQQTQRTNIQQPLNIQQTQSFIEQPSLIVSTSIMQQSQIPSVIPIQISPIIQQPIENQPFFEQSIITSQTNSWNDLQQVNVFPNIPIPTFVNPNEGNQIMRNFLNNIGVKSQSVEPIKRKMKEKDVMFYYKLKNKYKIETLKMVDKNIDIRQAVPYLTLRPIMCHNLTLVDLKDSEYIEIEGEDPNDTGETNKINIKIIRENENEKIFINHYWYNGSIKINNIVFGVGGLVKIFIDNEYECIYINVLDRTIIFEDKKFFFKRVDVTHLSFE